MDCILPGSSVLGISQARILGWVSIFSPGHLHSPGIEPVFPALQAVLFPAEPSGKLYLTDGTILGGIKESRMRRRRGKREEEAGGEDNWVDPFRKMEQDL